MDSSFRGFVLPGTTPYQAAWRPALRVLFPLMYQVQAALTPLSRISCRVSKSALSISVPMSLRYRELYRIRSEVSLGEYWWFHRSDWVWFAKPNTISVRLNSFMLKPNTSLPLKALRYTRSFSPAIQLSFPFRS